MVCALYRVILDLRPPGQPKLHGVIVYKSKFLYHSVNIYCITSLLSQMRSISINRISRTQQKAVFSRLFTPLLMQDSAIKIFYQGTANLTKVIKSNFYIDIAFRFFCNVKK